MNKKITNEKLLKMVADMIAKNRQDIDKRIDYLGNKIDGIVLADHNYSGKGNPALHFTGKCDFIKSVPRGVQEQFLNQIKELMFDRGASYLECRIINEQRTT